MPEVEETPTAAVEAPETGGAAASDDVLARAEERLAAMAAGATSASDPRRTPLAEVERPLPPPLGDFEGWRGQVIRNRVSGALAFVETLGYAKKPWSWLEGGRRFRAVVAQPVALLRLGPRRGDPVRAVKAVTLGQRWEVIDPATGEAREVQP